MGNSVVLRTTVNFCPAPLKPPRSYAPAFRHTEKICVDKRNTICEFNEMSSASSIAEVNIHLRARAQDRALIDQAASLTGANRSQFMMASALKEAKTVLLDQSTILADAKTFLEIMDWMDSTPTAAEATGMKRLRQAKAPWPRD